MRKRYAESVTSMPVFLPDSYRGHPVGARKDWGMKRSLSLLALGAIASLTVSASLAGPAEADTPTLGVVHETPAERNRRFAWFRQAGFGMFIHWGVYSVPGGVWQGTPSAGAGEWLFNDARIPLADYEQLQKQFNPTRFDAHTWVSIAKQAGMKYIVITTKHHDGFCMFDTKQTTWSIMGTPYHRDVLKALADECHKQGIRLCLYYSIMDWNHPDYLPHRGWDTRDAGKADFDRYVAYMKAELKELLTHYGPINTLWFDGEWEDTWTHERGVDLYNYVRSLQPSILISNRVDKGMGGVTDPTEVTRFAGDFATPEQFIPQAGLAPGLAWETCMTMNDTWGYKTRDQHWKSADTLLHNLIDTVSKGGNYLINVGPKPDGTFPEASVERLKTIGQWLHTNGEAIYGVTRSPYTRAMPWGRITRKPGRLYLHVFDRSGGEISLPGLSTSVRRIYALSDPHHRSLHWIADANGVTIRLPADLPAEPVSVLVMDVAGPLHVTATQPMLQQRRNGQVVLPAADAEVIGPNGGKPTARFEGESPGNIGWWTDPRDTVRWEFQLRRPGTYAVTAEVACMDNAAGATYTLGVGDQQLSGKVAGTGSWTNFVPVSLGTLRMTQPGKVTLTVVPTSAPKGVVMNLRTVRLLPQ